jgi:hypothetical protein
MRATALRKPVGGDGILDEFMGGVLNTPSARIMENLPFVVRVKAGAEADTLGRKPPQLVRMDDLLTSAIDHWREAQDDKLSRPEAIRRLVEIGLKAKTK